MAQKNMTIDQLYGKNLGDSQRFAPENSSQIAKMIVIHQNFRQYCRKAIWYPAQLLEIND